MSNQRVLLRLLLIFSIIRLTYFLNIANPTENECESVHRWSKREASKGRDQTSRVIKLALVIDNKLQNSIGGWEKEHFEKIVTELNSLFRQFNVSVTLVKTTFLTKRDESNLIKKTITITYNKFREYVKQLNRTNIDHFQLMSAMEFNENKNLIPYLKTNDMCELSVGVNRDLAYNEAQVARSIARVLAHNLGIHEDGVNCCVNQHDPCIMQKLHHYGREEWSNCSIKSLNEVFMSKTKYTCLK